MNTLGLDDDWEPVEVVEGVEAAFDIRVTDSEAATLLRVGDLHRLLRNRFSNSQEASGHCATAMTYYRLRRALTNLNVDKGTIRPENSR